MTLDQIIDKDDRVGIVVSNPMVRPEGMNSYYARVQHGANEFLDPTQHLDVAIRWSSDDHLPPAEDSFQDLVGAGFDGGPVETKSGHRELVAVLPDECRTVLIYASVVGQSIPFGIRGEWRA